jgi:phosphoribosylformylglycinamidine cyclo-ligase
MRKITYKSAGVDIDRANSLVRDYARFSALTRTAGTVGDIGSFGGMFRPAFRKFRDPLLVSSTDGVGTKLKIAFLAGRHDTVGIDLVAMSVNDILCSGAEGLFFLDYVSTGRIEPRVLRDIVKGVSVGCRRAGYALVGGETAEMPGMYKNGEYDLAGFGVGIVDRRAVIDGSAVRIGDAVLGIESSGLHSNGFSLVRKAFSRSELKRHADELLKPTHIYCAAVLAVKEKLSIKGIAHITGGAFYDKIPRVIPKGMAIAIDKSSWQVPWIFSAIRKKARLDDRQMYRTFNMGIGMALVLAKGDVDRAKDILRKYGFSSFVIGEVIKGNREVCVY